ncbi:PREDICTED: heparanase-like isoform X2 [Priapulus caudatus]|uniref:Heparanase-like isoform X2 n=1 Tax=Priapulus caudatus TaxID=37621 RepID=A0ABM1DTX7_PRICU|nr:PREDICTED: heparanase-like isoform X2 [Priapulus caudatus]
MRMTSVYFMLLLLVPAARVSGHRKVSISVETEAGQRSVDERFLSVALGASLINREWRTFDVRSAKLRRLANALSPAYLRLGGTYSDFLIFREDGDAGGGGAGGQTDCEDSDAGDGGTGEQTGHEDARETRWLDSYGEIRPPKNISNFTMTAHDWDNINTFASVVEWQLIFDLNVLLRNHLRWDPSNAMQLLAYTMHRGYHPDFELGNEPDSLKHAVNRTVSSKDLAMDFRMLSRILKQSPTLQSSHIVGPDVTRSKKKSLKYLKNFLYLSGDVVSAVTMHQYYVDGRTATLDNFTDPSVLNFLKGQLSEFVEAAKEAVPARPLWLGETGSAWGGGAKGLSDTYVAGFMWLDKLGLAAQMGIDVVIRQTFYDGHYALIDKELNPTPDYWLSYVYKTLIGNTVLKISSSPELSHLRLYAHCTNYRRSAYSKGSMTVFALNLRTHAIALELLQQQHVGNLTVHQYLLSPHGNSLTSRHVDLNGERLQLNTDDSLPTLRPHHLPAGRPIKFPGMTFAFYVLVDANAEACMDNKIW